MSSEPMTDTDIGSEEEQKKAVAAFDLSEDYKFNMQIEVLDGSTADAMEVWNLEGCFLTNVDYSDSDYATNEPVTVSLTIRYDNAIHSQGPSGIVSNVEAGNPFDSSIVPGATDNESA